MPRGACLRLRITTTRARSAAVGLTQRSVSGISAFGPFFERGWTTASFEGALGASLSCAGAPGATLIGAGRGRDVRGRRGACLRDRSRRRDGVGDRDLQHRRRAVAGPVGDGVAHVVGTVGVAGGVPRARHDGAGRAGAHRADAEDARRDPGDGVCSGPRDLDGALHDARRALARDCDRGGRRRRVDRDRDATAARRTTREIARDDGEAERAITRDGEVLRRRIAGVRAHGDACRQRARAGARRPVDGLRDVQHVGPRRPFEDGGRHVLRARQTQPGWRRRCLRGGGPGCRDRNDNRHEDGASNHVVVPFAAARLGDISAGRVSLAPLLRAFPRTAHSGGPTWAPGPYISSGALTPTRSSARASTCRVASQSASLDDLRSGVSASSTGQSR